MSSKPEYSIGSHVICQHSGMPYEAKIIDITGVDTPNPNYVVHYHGWNRRYDEEIPFSESAARLSEATSEAIASAKLSKESCSSSKKRRLRSENFSDEVPSESGSRCSSPSASIVKNLPLTSKHTLEETLPTAAAKLAEGSESVSENIGSPKKTKLETPRTSSILSKPEYSIGSHVICQHYGIPYEAKIIDITGVDTPNPNYVVHYHGLNSRHDEEIPFSESAARLSEATSEAIASAKLSKESCSSSKKRRLRSENFSDEVPSESGSRCSSPSASIVKNLPLTSKHTLEETLPTAAAKLAEGSESVSENIGSPKKTKLETPRTSSILSKPEYSIGSNVICLQYGTAYEAKIIDITGMDTPNPNYVIHYHGWNRRYDEEIPFSESAARFSEATSEAIAAAKLSQKTARTKTAGNI